MANRILDTSILIDYWNRCLAINTKPKTNGLVKKWAQTLIDLRETNRIVTPVAVEFMAGAQNKLELQLFRAFLEEFEMVDSQKISPTDWREALLKAERIPRSGKRRQLGDCLIRAIADRFHAEVITLEVDFPR